MTDRKSKSLSLLTKSLIVGTSTGAMALQVGCAPTAPETSYGHYVSYPNDKVPMGAGSELQVSSHAEGELCKAALANPSAANVSALMSQFPNSRCIPYLMNAMPASEQAMMAPGPVATAPIQAAAPAAPRAAPTVDVGRERGQY